MTSINFTINSVSVLNPKLNHHNARHSLLHSPTFHPFLKQNRTFKPSLQKPLTVTFVAPQHDSDHGEVEVEKGNMLEQLKIQVDKVTHALDAVTKKFITEEGNESFSYTTAKEIIETFSIPVDDLFSNVSGIRDFYVGIPYGYILSWGGFFSFMITGSIAAIRFGLVLGGALLALSILSLKSYRKGKPSFLALIGQTAIASILFLRKIGSVGRGSTYFTALISGAVVAFYVYRLVLEGKTQKGSNLEGEAGN
ncbi:unnamed protein product [Trifolium pratense]|uniref:Uncharacterized protein n=1 Tax=Trifolium pratense TaxID=57577 RepID=A0ACB0LRM2_TRIPR|nr:unnamed protein product [Trifolium pratense]